MDTDTSNTIELVSDADYDGKIDDVYAAKQFVKIMGEHLIYDETYGDLYVFNIDTCQW